VDVSVDESEFSLSASNISDVSADSVSGAHHSKTTQAKAGDGLSKSGDTLAEQNVTSVSSNTTAAAQDVVLADASGSSLTVTLPSPSTDVDVVVKKTDSSGNAVTIATPGGQTIDGQSSIGITAQYASRTVVSDGNNYFIT